MWLEFQYEVEDLAEMHRSLVEPGLKKRAIFTFLLGICLMTVVYLVGDVRLPTPWLLGSFAMFCITGFVVLFAKMRADRPTTGRIQKQLSDAPDLSGIQTVEMSEHGIIWESENSRTELAWKSFSSYLETPKLFFVISHPSLVRILPKRAMKSEAEVQEVRRLLAAQIGSVYPQKPTTPSEPDAK